MRKLVEGAARGLWRLGCLGLECGQPFTRFDMYRRLKLVLDASRPGGPYLSISHSPYLCSLAGAQEGQVTEASYPDASIFDLPYPSESFGVVASDQVFEHIEGDPQLAVDEVFRVLKPGGIAVHTTCFFTPFHGNPTYGVAGDGDFWRFTWQGLRLLHKGYSEVIEADGWGHPLLPLLTGVGLTLAPVPLATWHPFNRMARVNRSSYHAMVWVVARK